MPDRPLCVYCRQRPAEDPWTPFCRERCKMADLGRWLSGNYRIPVRPDIDDDPAASPDSPDEPDRS